MGLLQQLQNGAVLDRQTKTFQVAAVGSGSIDLAPAAAILNIFSSNPVRIRFYDDVASRDEAGEITRPFLSSSQQNISLVADVSMSSAGNYYLDPVVYSVSPNSTLYYRIDNPGNTPNIILTIFPLEDSTIEISPPNKRTLSPIFANLGPSEMSSGSISGGDTPKTFLLVSASLTVGNLGRIRLYSKEESINDVVEKARPFTTEASASVGLITDAIISSSIGSGLLHFTPKLIGANLDNISTSLSNAQVDGLNQIHYILQNVDTVGGTVPISASIHLFSLED